MEKATTSTAWGTVSAVMKGKLADALASDATKGARATLTSMGTRLPRQITRPLHSPEWRPIFHCHHKKGRRYSKGSVPQKSPPGCVEGRLPGRAP
jgi:hypothetical protein